MATPLTTDDLARAESATQTLLTPLSHRTVDDWRRDVTHELKALVGAGVSAFLLPNAEVTPLLTEEAPPPAEEYFELATPFYKEYRVYEKMAQTPVITLTGMMRERRSEYLNRPYAQELLHPRRCFESVTLCLPPRDRPGSLATMAHLHLHKTRPQERFGEKELAILRLVYPAFRTGVETVQRLKARREKLLQTLDVLDEGTLLIDVDGRVLHANRALATMRAQDAQFQEVETAMMRLGRGLAPGGTPLLGALTEQEVTTDARCYRLRVTVLEEDLMGRRPATLVTAGRCERELPSAHELRHRFGLTARQATVARLLAGRQSNEEIAEALFISEHTARHHVEAVLLRLDLHSRTDVRQKLLGE